MDAAAVAGPNQQLHIGLQKWATHRHQGPVRHHVSRVIAEDFDEAEDVIPSPAVEPGRGVTKFEKDLVHLKCAPNGLDQHRGPYGALGNAGVILSEDEDVIPKARLQVAFQLWEIEVRRCAPGGQCFGVVEKVKAEVEQRTRDRLSAERDVLLHQMPSAGPHHQRGHLLVESIPLAFGAGVADGSSDGVAEIDLALDVVCPGRRIRIFEIRHEDAGAGVERVDHHFSFRRPGDFDAAVGEVGGNWGYRPLGIANSLRFGQETRHLAGIDRCLALNPAYEQFSSPCAEAPFELRDESDGLRCQDPGEFPAHWCVNRQAIGRHVSTSHPGLSLTVVRSR